jgi:hypothetical protein
LLVAAHKGGAIVDHDVQDQMQSHSAGRSRRAWRTPEIVNVGDALDLTEAVSGNLNDGSAGSLMVSYAKTT